MVAVISTMQEFKDGFPAVVISQEQAMGPKTAASKKHVILTSWASVATALLIVVLIGGAFYVADLRARECTTTSPTRHFEHNTKDYHRTFKCNGKTTNEDFHLDEVDQTELMVKKNDDGDIDMITATDFKRKISASYIPSFDECVLVAGEDMDWLADWNEEEKDKTIEVLEDELEEENFRVSDNKVTDLSILPKELKPFCQGKATYWLQPDGDDSTEIQEADARQKRCIKITVRIRKCIRRRFLFFRRRKKCRLVNVERCS